MQSFLKAGLVFAFLLLMGCGGGGSGSGEMVDYNGTISEVKRGDQIVTVQIPDTLESVDPGSVDLMFTDTTRVINASYMEMPFDSLRADQQVRVEAQKQGDQQVPIRLTILN